MWVIAAFELASKGLACGYFGQALEHRVLMDSSQNVGRNAHGLACAPCITPKSKIYDNKTRRYLCGIRCWDCKAYTPGTYLLAYWINSAIL